MRTSERERYWRQIVARHEKSGLSVAAFCRKESLCAPTLYRWRRKIAKRQAIGFAVERDAGGRADDRSAGTVAPRRGPPVYPRRIRRGQLARRPGRPARGRVIHLPASVRVYLCTSPCDMRKSFDTLHAVVRDSLQLDAFGGHLFVFINRRRDQARFRIPIGFCSH